MNKITSIYYNIKNGISNLVYWFPIIWKNSWWDHAFLEKIIIHQLQYMHDNWDESCYIGKEKDKKTIKICLETLKRVNKDEYSNMFDIKDNFVEDNVFYDENGDKIFNPCWKIYWKGTEVEVKSHELPFPDYEKQRDLEVFCRCFKENIFKWWD